MISPQNEFYVDIARLDGLMKKKGLSDCDLSKGIGKSRSWLNSVRKRADANRIVRIERRTATEIARILECLIQDFEAEQSNYLVEPMDIEYERAAQDRLKMLLEQNPEYAADLLEYAVKADLEERGFLLSALRLLSAEKQSKTNDAYDKWFQYLLVTQIGKAIASQLAAATESQLRREYLQAKEDKKDYDEMREALKRILLPKIQKITRNFEWDCTEEVLEGCTDFLFKYFEVSSPGVNAIVELYKRGRWALFI